MGPSQKLTIAICGNVGREVDELVALVRQATQFDAMRVLWPDRPALETARALPPAGYVLLGAPEGLAAELANRPSQIPLLAIGGSAAPLGATCWLARRPPLPALGILLAQLNPRDGRAEAGARRGPGQ